MLVDQQHSWKNAKGRAKPKGLRPDRCKPLLEAAVRHDGGGFRRTHQKKMVALSTDQGAVFGNRQRELPGSTGDYRVHRR